MTPITQNINFAPCDGVPQITSHMVILVPKVESYLEGCICEVACSLGEIGEKP